MTDVGQKGAVLGRGQKITGRRAYHMYRAQLKAAAEVAASPFQESSPRQNDEGALMFQQNALRLGLRRDRER